MELYLEKIKEKLQNSDFIKKFIKELGNALEKGEYMEDRKLTNQEQLEFERRKFKFLQEYFKDELSDLNKGEIYIVTNKYENDEELHRYKVTQYKNNMECKYIAFEKDLPDNVKLGDVVRKIDEKYVFDEQATQYVNESTRKLKEDIIKNR